MTQKENEMGYRAGENYYTHYTTKDGRHLQCDYCEHNWDKRSKLGLANARCPRCGRKLCSSKPTK